MKVNSISNLVYPVQRMDKLKKDKERKQNFQKLVMQHQKGGKK